MEEIKDGKVESKIRIKSVTNLTPRKQRDKTNKMECKKSEDHNWKDHRYSIELGDKIGTCISVDIVYCDNCGAVDDITQS